MCLGVEVLLSAKVLYADKSGVLVNKGRLMIALLCTGIFVCSTTRLVHEYHQYLRLKTS